MYSQIKEDLKTTQQMIHYFFLENLYLKFGSSKKYPQR